MVTVNGNEFMVAWTSAGSKSDLTSSGEIVVGPWPDHSGWSSKYSSTAGCCDAFFKSQSSVRKVQILCNLFVHLVLGCGFDPEKVHREFKRIDIWREMTIDLPSGSYVAYRPNGDWSPHNP